MAHIAVTAQETNRVPPDGYSAFRIISERNIFNQDRKPGKTIRATQAEQTTDAFSLVGTMSYEKGNFAFFDGTASEFRKILKPGGGIAGFTVTQITPKSVILQNGDQKLELKVGEQLSRNDEGLWRLAVTAKSWSEPPHEDSGGEVNDVLKKLMQQREKELK